MSIRVGVTGAGGFLGWHLRCRMRLAGWPEPVLADRETFADPSTLADFVQQCDAVVHLAGVNRASSPEEVVDGNRFLADALAKALEVHDEPRPVVYANSVKALEPGFYGEAKAAVGDRLASACARTGGTFTDVLLPHLFGEFGVPFYNSAVTTFGHQLAVGEEPRVDVDATLELLHAQDASQMMLDWLEPGDSDTPLTRRQPAGQQILVSEALATLQSMYQRYVVESTIPDVSDRFELQMFNLLRSQLFTNGVRSFPIVRHSDQRGYFSELIRADGLGQSSISASVPGITRGDHYHLEKIERFLVLTGDATIRIRRLLTDEVHEFQVSGDEPVAIDMPPLCTHNISNTGDAELLTFFWAADHFDPANPDTYPEPVVPA